MNSKLKEIEINLSVPTKHDYSYTILVTRWNNFITNNLLQGALKALEQSGVDDKQICVIRVPGAMELPLIAQQVATHKSSDAIIALGCVIQGGTPHFEYVCSECTHGLGHVQRQFGIPISFGVLTVHSTEQAIERSNDDSNNKGYEAAITAIEMVQLIEQIQQ